MSNINVTWEEFREIFKEADNKIEKLKEEHARERISTDDLFKEVRNIFEEMNRKVFKDFPTQ